MKQFLLIGLLFFSVVCFAQEEENVSFASQSKTNDTAKYINKIAKHYATNTSLGFGIDYGGIGMNVTILPKKFWGIFVAGGYAIAGFGWNAGTIFKIAPNSPVCPYASAMYGYNAALTVEGPSGYNKLFYGPSFGAGLEFRSQIKMKNYFSVGLIVPIRDKRYTLSSDLSDYGKISSLSSVAFSIGYHFAFE